jgi:AP-3 complex subunit mu
MIESIYILDTASKALILQHTYTGRPPPDALLEYFQSLLLSDPNSYPPSILTVPSNVVNVSTILFHTKSTNNSLILLTPITREPHDATGVIELLNRITEVLEAYFGKEKLGRGIVEGNFDIVEELLGEIVDSGEIMTTESNALRDIVLPPSLLNKFMSAAGLQGYILPMEVVINMKVIRTCWNVIIDTLASNISKTQHTRILCGHH